MLSNKINKIEESEIRKIFNLSARQNKDILNFSIGQPHFSTPKGLRDAAKEAIDNGQNKYTPTLGVLPLREKIVEKLNKENNIKANLDNVMITSGAAGAIFLALSAILNPGDEVILPDPYFVLYKQLLNYLEVKVIFLDTYPDFRIDEERLKSLVTPKTKMIIVNSPNNPTGIVYSQEELEKVAEIAKANDLWILSDEIYESFDYDKKFFSIGSIYDKTITINGFSKNFSITGWRVGYMCAPEGLIDAMNKLQQYSFVCAPSFAQVALVKAFDLDLLEEYNKYKKKRDFIYQELSGKYVFAKPEGAFYAFIKKPVSDRNFVKTLLDKNIMVVPGGAFSERDEHFRISFAVDDEILKKGINIMKELV